MSNRTDLTIEGSVTSPEISGRSGPAGAELPKLSGRAKAAIIVRMLMNEGADLPLDELPDELQASLTQQMGQMGLVDRTTLFAVIQEFAEKLDGVGLSFPKGIDDALSSLDGKISPQTAARLRKEAGVRMKGDPWDRLRALTTEELVPMVLAESTEIAAVILSMLDVKHAASLLSQIPGTEARRIALAVSQTANVTPEVVDRIGLSLATQLEERPVPAFAAEPGQRVGEILNLSPATMRQEMLDALEQEDQEFAQSVRKSIFVFGHIPDRIAPKDVPAIIREVDQAELVQALSYSQTTSDAAAVEFLLTNISSRMADNIRDEITELAEVSQTDGETAQNSVISAIRLLQERGEVTLRSAPADAGS